MFSPAAAHSAAVSDTQPQRPQQNDAEARITLHRANGTDERSDGRSDTGSRAASAGLRTAGPAAQGEPRRRRMPHECCCWICVPSYDPVHPLRSIAAAPPSPPLCRCWLVARALPRRPICAALLCFPSRCLIARLRFPPSYSSVCDLPWSVPSQPTRASPLPLPLSSSRRSSPSARPAVMSSAADQIEQCKKEIAEFKAQIEAHRGDPEVDQPRTTHNTHKSRSSADADAALRETAGAPWRIRRIVFARRLHYFSV